MFSRYWWVLLTGFVVGPVVGFLIAAVITYQMPKRYESTATVEIKLRQTPITELSGQSARNPIANEVQIVTTRPVLEKAVDSMDFANKWAVDRETAIGILKGSIQARQIAGTDLMSISARFTDSEDARDMVSGVLGSYSDYRERLLSEPLLKTINSMRKALREQEDRVEERRKILALIARKGDSSDVGKQDYVDAKREYETELALQQELRLKVITQQIEEETGGSNSFVVHEEPVVNPIPASPHVSLNLILGATSGLVFSPLITLPLMWLLNLRKREA
jgi:uncharacterized protein involved in exopolysaccharide biosynthesis